MKFLNLGCGATRPAPPWINIDDLHSQFPNAGCPERRNMDAEPNYLNHDLINTMPFDDNTVDGILASHLIEHLVLMEALDLIDECYRVLRPEGVLRIGVPCPKKFHEGTIAGKTDWGEPFHLNRGKTTNMMNYALFFHGHKQVLGADSIFCMLFDAGFRQYVEKAFTHTWMTPLADFDNRPEFTLFVEGRK
jgi:predicted SAM-dependent methyltransferase